MSSFFTKLFMTRAYSLPRLENSVKLDISRNLDAKVIPELWTAHFSEKPGNLGVSMSAKVANSIKSRLSNYRMFILPVSRLTGHEIVLLESVVDENFVVQVTGLEEYKQMGPQAPTKASFTFFTELATEKDLTLIHGRFNESQLNSTQSSALLQNFCAAYSNDELFRWVKDFSDRPNEFNFDQFLSTFTAAASAPQ